MPGMVPRISETAFAVLSAPNSVSRLRVELCTDIPDDPGDEFVEVVKLIHEEGVVPGRVRGNYLQLILSSPCDAYCVRDHPCEDKDGVKRMPPGIVSFWAPQTRNVPRKTNARTPASPLVSRNKQCDQLFDKHFDYPHCSTSHE